LPETELMTSKWKRAFLRDCLQVDLVDDELIREPSRDHLFNHLL
jgi:hypothetical protein